MKRRKKEKIKSWGVAIVIIFMALMLVLAYMPMLFVPDEEEVGSNEETATSTRDTLPN
jgi:uncharacterized protein YpmB